MMNVERPDLVLVELSRFVPLDMIHQQRKSIVNPSHYSHYEDLLLSDVQLGRQKVWDDVLALSRRPTGSI